ATCRSTIPHPGTGDELAIIGQCLGKGRERPCKFALLACELKRQKYRVHAQLPRSPTEQIPVWYSFCVISSIGVVRAFLRHSLDIYYTHELPLRSIWC